MSLAAVRRTLIGAWTRRGPLAWLLWPLSLIYRLLWNVRVSLYRRGWPSVHQAGVPLIVVGNVVAGGAGKTPVVMALVTHLQSLGLRPGVVARGYGRSTRRCQSVQAGSRPQDVGDEPLLIHRRTGAPVFVAPARIDAARALLEHHPEVDVLIADDGLQHLALHRDIEVCVFDERGVGNGFLLPAGPLREPWPRQTDLMLYSGAHEPHPLAFRVKRELAGHALRVDGSMLALETLKRPRSDAGQPLRAVAGTAQPEVFFAMLRERGLPLSTTQALPDHAAFDAAQWPQTNGETLLCTEKDAVKLWQHRVDALAVPLIVQPDPRFWTALERLLLDRGSPQLRAKLSSGNGYTPT